jgi:hypothetical protein
MVDGCKTSREYWCSETQRRRPKNSKRNLSQYHFAHRKNPRILKMFFKRSIVAQVSRKLQSSALSVRMTPSHTLLSKVNQDSAISDPAGMASCVCAFDTTVKFSDRKRRPHFRNCSRKSGLDSDTLGNGENWGPKTGL